MARPVSRRRQFFIKKEFQGKFILLYAVVIISLAGLIAFQLYRSGQNVLDQNLYISHVKIESTGDILFGLLLETNILAAFGIVLIVIILSFVVFSRLNTHFFRMEERLDAMAGGDFTTPSQPPSRFHEISRLISMVQGAQDDYRQRFGDIAEALNEIETGCGSLGDSASLERGKEKLRKILDKITLPETLL